MTPEVKDRIEQIRHGNVPEGYKKGKIGIVPVDWDEVSFSTLFTSTSEYTDDLKKYPLYSLTTIPCRPREQYAQGFLGYLMNSPAYHNQLLPLMQGTKVTSVSKSALQDTILCCPTDTMEQTLIGDYFISLDHLITLHQRKLDEMQKQKKALMQLLLTGIVRVKT